jgi:hypothetical protein
MFESACPTSLPSLLPLFTDYENEGGRERAPLLRKRRQAASGKRSIAGNAFSDHLSFIAVVRRACLSFIRLAPLSEHRCVLGAGMSRRRRKEARCSHPHQSAVWGE